MIFKICALAVISACAAIFLKEFGWRGVPVFGVIALVGMIGMAEPYLSKISGLFTGLGREYGFGEAAEAVLKIIGIGYLAGITADICKELGAGSIGSGVIMLGRIEIIYIAIPYFEKIVKCGAELIG